MYLLMFTSLNRRPTKDRRLHPLEALSGC